MPEPFEGGIVGVDDFFLEVIQEGGVYRGQPVEQALAFLFGYEPRVGSHCSDVETCSGLYKVRDGSKGEFEAFGCGAGPLGKGLGRTCLEGNAGVDFLESGELSCIIRVSTDKDTVGFEDK